MRRLLGQLIVVAVGAVALVALSGVSTLLQNPRPVLQVDSAATIAGVQAQLADARQQLQRAHEIIAFSTRYAIPADLSTQIYDIAAAEGVPPAVGFQLVKVESGFQNNAQSAAAAIGLTQLRLPTARVYDATVNADDLMNASTNLRLGFRYLKDLMTRFGNDIPTALEAYNKGPTFITTQQQSGLDVAGVYSHAILHGLGKRVD